MKTFWVVLMMIAASARAAERIPSLHGETFSGARVELPEAFHNKVGVLVMGFSRGSSDGVAEWGRKLAGSYPDPAGVVYFEMPALAAVPKLLRGVVMGRIKAAVAEPARPHFLPLLEDEAAWRKVAHYRTEAPDAAYILVVDATGTVRWQTQGVGNEAAFSELRRQVARVSQDSAQSVSK